MKSFLDHLDRIVAYSIKDQAGVKDHGRFSTNGAVQRQGAGIPHQLEHRRAVDALTLRAVLLIEE